MKLEVQVGVSLRWQQQRTDTMDGKLVSFKFDLQPGSLTDQVAGEHQPEKKTSISSEIKR